MRRDVDGDVDKLERRLADARALLDGVQVRDVRAAVRVTLSNPGRARYGRFRRVGRGSVLALAAVLIIVSGAVAARFGLPDVLFQQSQQQGEPLDDQTPIGQGWTFDSEITLEQAESDVDWTVVWPQSLGRPDHVYEQRIGAATMISLVYNPRVGYPAGGSGGPGVLLVEVGGALENLQITKTIPEGGVVEAVNLAGVTGYWVAGTFHQFAIDARNGEHLLHQVGGQTLVWQSGGVVYRLETRAGKDVSVALARKSLPLSNVAGTGEWRLAID
jgi:hypothetical protein